MYEISIFLKYEGSCITNDKLNTHNCQYLHKAEKHNSRPIIVEGRFYTELPAYIKDIKKVLSLKRNSSSFL
jgi:hypothetical protein